MTGNNCVKCKKKKSIENTDFCKKCFILVFEKRIRKFIRTQVKLKKDDSILVLDPICKNLINQIDPRMNVKYISKQKISIKEWNLDLLKNQKLIDLIRIEKSSICLVPLTRDHFLTYYLNQLLLGKRPSKKIEKVFINENYKKNKIIIVPLFSNILNSELSLYCKIKGLKNPTKIKNTNFLLENIENKTPGTKSSLFNAIKNKTI